MEARIEGVTSGYDAYLGTITFTIVIAWQDEERGFGQITIRQTSYLGEDEEVPEAYIVIDSEFMSEDFVKSVLESLVNHALFEHWEG